MNSTAMCLAVIMADKFAKKLVGQLCAITILKNMSSSVGKDDIPYIMEE